MTPPPDPPGDKNQIPGPGEIAQAIHALTTFLRNGAVTPDQRPFDKRQLSIEAEFRAVLRGLGRPLEEDRPGRFHWISLTSGRLELAAPLPPEITEIGGYTVRRREVWRIAVAATSKDRREFADGTITAVDVVRLRAFDAFGDVRLVGSPAPRKTSPSTPPVVL
ncbi:hypothetical protein [Actinomycetospora aeridis]|uniref:Uncharacterized protein n=1 Tax=Actinomycetospora aeridis TaxID=3129231 RepID=A0ABU8N1Q8_9PSEU